MNNINDFLPEEISDEGAYQFVTFFMNITAALESHYFAQMRRYQENNKPKELPACLKKTS